MMRVNLTRIGTTQQLSKVLLILFVSTTPSAWASSPLYWQVSGAGDWGVPEYLGDVKFPTIKAACEAGVRWKEEYWGKDGYKYRSLGGIDARKNPETGADGGPYSWGNWGLMPKDPGFDDSSRLFYCNHEYLKPGRTSWATYWYYSGASVELRGYNCPSGTLWDSDVKGCLTPPPSTCPSALTPNPIDTATGNKYFVVSDFSGGTAFPLPFKRYYSTLRSEWSHSFSQEISLQRRGNRVLVRRASGDALEFKLANNAWVPAAHITAELFEERDANGIRTGWRYVEGDVEEHYDANGQLSTLRIPDQGVYQLTRNGQELTVTAPSGASILLTLDANSRLTSFLTPDSEHYRYLYDSKSGISRLKVVLYPDDTPGTWGDNLRRQYLYEDPTYPGYITGFVDALGNRIATIDYDEQGRATLSELAAGAERVTVAYHADGSATITNALGKQTTYHFTSQGQRKLLTDVEGHPSQNCAGAAQAYTYTPEGWLATQTDWRGNTTRFAYNSNGQRIQETQAEGQPEERIITYTWHETLDKVTRIREPLRATDFGYDDLGRVLSKVESDPSALDARTWTYSYHPDVEGPNGNVPGKLAKIDGPRESVQDVTQFEYDTQGNLSAQVNALGHRLELADHDEVGRTHTILDPNGVSTRISYDYRGRITSQTKALPQAEAITAYEYDAVGQLKQVTLPDNTYLQYDYDAAGRLISVENGTGNRVELDYDALGNVTAERIEDASGVVAKSHTQAFDELGRLIRSIEADGDTTHYGYDLNSNRVSVTDANTQETRRAFDALNRLSSITDPLGGKIKFSYDAADNLTSVTDARGLVTQYEYNFAGDVTAIHSPDTGTTTFEHDAAGNVIRRVDARGVETTYQYDALNRLTAVQYPANPEENVTYRYDNVQNGNVGIGRLTGITDRTGTTSYVYDELGRLVQEQRVIESQSYITAYSYDLAGKLAGMVYPSGRVVNYQYDSAGRLTGMTTAPDAQTPAEPVVSNVGHLPFGPIHHLTYGNGLIRQLTYNQDYQLTLQDSPVMARSYDYDRVGNIAGITDSLAPEHSQTFGYDPLSRLTRATGSYGDIDYGYDANGNRLNRTVTHGLSTLDETYDYATDSHHLLSVSTTENGLASERAFSYNAAGNLIEETASDRVQTLNYNQQNRLEEVQRSDPLTTLLGEQQETLALYLHNALGQRVVKVATDPEANRHFVYDRQGLLIAESGSNGEVLREYLYLNGTPIAVLDNGSESQPLAEPVDLQWEAEQGTWENAAIDNLHAGYSGEGFVDYLGEGYLEWPLAIPATGEYQVEITYALHAAARPLLLQLNGVDQTVLQFPSTTAWTDWQVETTTLSLSEGVQMLRLQTQGSSGANIDRLRIRSVQPQS